MGFWSKIFHTVIHARGTVAYVPCTVAYVGVRWHTLKAQNYFVHAQKLFTICRRMILRYAYAQHTLNTVEVRSRYAQGTLLIRGLCFSYGEKQLASKATVWIAHHERHSNVCLTND